MKADFIPGKWIITHTSDFSFRKILDFLPLLAGQLDRNIFPSRPVRAAFSREFPVNRLIKTPGGLFLQIRETDLSFDDSRKPSPPDPGFPPISTFTPIRSIGHLLLYHPADSRWSGIRLTPASLFLGSALVSSGYRFSIQKCNLLHPPSLPDADLLALTLFEDHFLEYRNFFSGRLDSFTGLLAAGGPLVTLHGPPAVYHLPGIHLWFRGEAENFFPRWISAYNRRNLGDLLKLGGFFFRRSQLIIFSDFHRPVQLLNLDGLRPRADFLSPRLKEQGLEINLSRGCRRRCLYCSRVQGARIRKLPAKGFDRLLAEWGAGKASSRPSASRATVNINDDDILAEPDYAREVFTLIRRRGFSLWGVQTSLASLFRKDAPDLRVLNLLKAPLLFGNRTPLVWVGTDAFIPDRAAVLGKYIPPFSSFRRLLGFFEKNRILNYHYWISSDHRSGWETFVREFTLLITLLKEFPHFHLLAHSPFLIPYPSTALFQNLQEESRTHLIDFKKKFPAAHPFFVLRLVRRVKTAFENLNRLLENRSGTGQPGFFDCLGDRDFHGCLQAIYYFLKQDRLLLESAGGVDSSRSAADLRKLEERLVGMLSSGLYRDSRNRKENHGNLPSPVEKKFRRWYNKTC